jgi:hypothetical protein
MSGKRALEVHMTPESERLLDEGMENLDQVMTTDELRPQKLANANRKAISVKSDDDE